MSNENTTKTNTCPKCGATFTCGADKGNCWCQNIKISADNIKLLKSKYKTCLCPACLAAFSEKNGGGSCDN